MAQPNALSQFGELDQALLNGILELVAAGSGDLGGQSREFRIAHPIGFLGEHQGALFEGFEVGVRLVVLEGIDLLGQAHDEVMKHSFEVRGTAEDRIDGLSPIVFHVARIGVWDE